MEPRRESDFNCRQRTGCSVDKATKQRGAVGVSLRFVASVCVLIGFLFDCRSAFSQPNPESNAFELPVTVNPPRDRLRAMYEAATLAEREQYPAAAKVLQSVLESPEDYFLEHDLQSTLKQRALDLLASWPQPGREAYERQYSADAAVLLERAQRSGTWDDWSALLSQYWMTPAGRTAAAQWASQAFDAGEPLSAGRYWLQLREANGVREKDLAAGLREALAWELAGRADLRRARLALFGVESNLTPAVIGGRTFAGANALDEATEWINSHVALPGDERGRRTVAAWISARGDAARNAVAMPAGPIGTPVWTAALLGELCEPLVGAGSPHRRAVLQQSLVDLEERLFTEDRLTIPAAIPVVNQGVVVVRTLACLAAFDLESGKLRWRSSLDESSFRKQWNALPQQAAVTDSVPTSNPSLQQFLREKLFRDSLHGTITSSARLVFAIESNLELPPPPPARNVIRPAPETPDPVNRLVAFDLHGGQLLWELGGPRGDAELPLAGHFFLGPPLLADDFAYCLAECDSELRLLQLRIDQDARAPALVWSQVLVAPDQPVSMTTLRRVSGLTPTWAEGLLICPTGCGVIVAVDPLRRQLAWGMKYDSLEPRELTQRTLMMMRAAGTGRVLVPVKPDEELTRWIDPVPIYAQGHVVITPRDGSDLICLDAVTGEVNWRRPRGAALMVAGVQADRVIVVGRSSVESLRLSDGEVVWTLPTPVPAGQGLMLPQRYLLPVVDHQILTIDLAQGRVLSHSQFDPAVGTGNLIAAGGALVATSPHGIARFASLSQMEKDLNQRLVADAEDAAALALRGELRLHRGDEATGLDDLRKSLQRRSDARTASLLANSLLDGLRADFPRFRERAGEIDRLLANSPARSEFLRTYANALAEASEPIAAFSEYLKLVELPDYEERLERMSGGWSVRGDRVVRAQVRALFQSAGPVEQQQLDAALAAFGAQAVSEEQAAARDRRLLRFFDGLPTLDQIRLTALTRKDDTPLSFRFLIARGLAESQQKECAATGTAWLARELIAQQRLFEARPWLERLEREFAAVRISLGSNGEVSTGQQFVTAQKSKWEDPLAAGGWGAAEIVVQRKARATPIIRNIPVEVRGPRPEAWRDWTFEITDAPAAVLAARDPHGRLRWRVDVSPQSMPHPFPRFNSQAVSHSLHIAGDRMVIALSGRFVVLDLSAGLTPVVRWQQDLTTKTDANAPTPVVGQRVDYLACGRRRVLPTSTMDLTDASPAGQVLGLTEEFVSYVQGGRLVAADVDSGRILWIRLGVPQMVEGTATAEAVTLFDLDRAQSVTYRSDDGAELSRRVAGDPQTWLWFEGDRLLTVTPIEGGTVKIALEHLGTNQVVWERTQLPSQTRFFKANGGFLFQWSPTGELQKLRLADGGTVWKQPTPAVETGNFLRVESFDDLDVVFVGTTSNVFETTRITVFDSNNHTPFQGHVLGVQASTGETKWSLETGPTAIDWQMRSNVPILPLVARQSDPARIVNGQFIAPMRFVATFVDKRTGDVLFKTVETAQPQQFQFEIDNDQPAAMANFTGWTMEFRKAE